MFRFVPRFAAVLILVVAGTLAPAAAEEREFKASSVGVVYIDSGYMIAGLEATHLGKATFNGNVDPYSLANSQILEIPAYLTAANGDRLYLDSVVDYVVDDGTDTAIGIAIGTLTFTGGTGRFQDATGSADVTFVFDLNLQKFVFLIDGSIDY